MLPVEGLVACRGYAVAHHKCLGEVFRAFEHGTSLRRTNHGHVLRPRISLQVIVDALHQRVFGTYHHHVYPLVSHELLDGLKVIGLHTDVLAP